MSNGVVCFAAEAKTVTHWVVTINGVTVEIPERDMSELVARYLDANKLRAMESDGLPVKLGWAWR